MKFLPSYINGKERELYKETEDGQEIFYYEDNNLIIRNFVPEDANAWCCYMHPDFLKRRPNEKKYIIKDIKERIKRDLNPEYSSDDILEFTCCLSRKNGQMFGTMVLKEFPEKEEKEQRMRITLFINGKDKSILKKNTLEAIKALQTRKFLLMKKLKNMKNNILSSVILKRALWIKCSFVVNKS